MKITEVKKSRKPATCCVCRGAIEVGAPYKWTAAYRGPKLSAHVCCDFRQSHLTSGRLGEVYAAQEAAQDAWQEAADDDDRASVIESLVEELQRLADEYQEAADSIGEHFDGSDQHTELEEKVGEIEGWIDTLNDGVNDLREFEDDFDTAEERARALLDLRCELEGMIDDCPV